MLPFEIDDDEIFIATNYAKEGVLWRESIVSLSGCMCEDNRRMRLLVLVFGSCVSSVGCYWNVIWVIICLLYA